MKSAFFEIRFQALELFEGTLDQIFLNKGDLLKYSGSMPSEKAVLFQLANGLDYIHSRGIVHRNIKPENVMIVRTANDGPAYVKWGGLELCKQLVDPHIGQIDCDPFELLRGTMNWMAPELLKFLLENIPSTNNGTDLLTVQSDLFSAGCLFFFFLAGGIHPFGTEDEIVPNILSGKRANLNSKLTFFIAFL